MATSLKKLLKIGGLRHCKVVAGHQGLEKTVSYVTVMEVPDIINWLKGNELLLTSLYPIKDDPVAQLELIDRLHEVGTTAVAVKPNRFIGAIPEEMKRKADEYGMPLLEIPEEISYLDILPPAMNVIFDEKVVLQEDLDQTSHLLSEISLYENGLSSFMDTLALLTKTEVYLEALAPYIEVPPQKHELAPLTTQQVNELKVVQRAVRMPRRKQGEELEDCIVSPIIIDGELQGTVSSFHSRSEYIEMELAILEKASMLLSLEFLRKKVKYDIEQQYRNDFFRDLFFNQFINKQDLMDKGKMYGFQAEEAYVCISVSGKEVEDGKMFASALGRIESVLTQIEEDIVVGSVRHSLYVLLPVKDRTKPELKKMIGQFATGIKQVVQIDVSLGVGRTYSGVDGLRKSFREAEQAVVFGPVFWKDQPIIYFSNLGAYRLIALIENRDELEQFYEETVGPLAKNDLDSELNLVETLEQYFKHNESLTETAKDLYIHVNTLKYRLQKIKTISGLNLQKTEEKLMLNMGLKIHRYLESDCRFR
ncbi:PucR family transcriptional regulator ligand-binding domain-containing protein [Alkalihalobacillus oceani]|uniref:PucR family transcriptional regulator n=1 Tax=Halalkalibacter oceani TaxID=1653776 RepID=UPI00203AF68E|nr:PucR family transcriptional regulator [Halalkalibacter oceani]MCM3762323.1 PucR family transcriptional regulator ligand-binding domain-containing protein [Halalkalibacter oceani]